jgi:hypothetical protein
MFVPPAKLLAWFHAKIRLDTNFRFPQNPHSGRLDQI